MKRKVILEGELGELFGKERIIFAESYADVFSCLNANFKNFQDYLVDCDNRGIGFMMHVDGNFANTEEEVLIQHPPGTMTISPAPMGSSGKIGGVIKIIAAVVIAFVVVPAMVACFTGTAALTAALTFKAGSLAASIMAYGAIALALSGMMDLLAPDPSVDRDQSESYVFQGAQQNIVEGDPVPVLYGKLRIPGRPISFEARNASQAFVNYTRRGNSAADSSSNFIDTGLYGGTTYGGDGNSYYRNLESQNSNYLGGGRAIDNNPNFNLV